MPVLPGLAYLLQSAKDLLNGMERLHLYCFYKSVIHYPQVGLTNSLYTIYSQDIVLVSFFHPFHYSYTQTKWHPSNT